VLGRLLGGGESRAYTPSDFFKAGLDFPRTTSSGVNVSQENALQITAVYAAVRLITDSISMLPIDAFVRTNGERRAMRPKPAWIDDPSAEGQPRQAFLSQWLVSKLIGQAACIRILRDGEGEPLAFSVLNPQLVERKRDDRGAIYYTYDGGKYRLPAEDVIYDAEVIRPGSLMGLSRVDELREMLGLSQALQSFSAAFFGSGSTIGGVLEVPGDVTEDQAKGMQDAWEKGHQGLRRAHRPGILSGGAKFVRTAVDPDEAQMLGSREFGVEEVCRAFRIPPNMLQSQKPGSVAYASREQDSIQFVTYTLMPYITAIESHLSRLLPRQAFVRFNVDALVRASVTERYAAYSQGMQAGFLNINTINRLEDRPAVEGGDEYRVSLANVSLSAANVAETEIKVNMAATLIGQGADPAATLAAFGLPVVPWAAPEPADPADDPAEDVAEPTRTVRSVERDGQGNIIRIIEES
jgi:HK97 family phage portal protein